MQKLLISCVFQEAIMKPLDHKNLDRDVPYFADVVRYDCALFLSHICHDTFILTTYSCLFVHAAPQKTCASLFGTAWRSFSRRTACMRSKCMKRTRILLYTEANRLIDLSAGEKLSWLQKVYQVRAAPAALHSEHGQQYGINVSH